MAHMTLDLNGYFERIGYRGAADPTFDVLHELVTAHTRTIPFENLDPLLGVPVDDLSPEALADKMVHRGRGGYCYEQNGLMGYVLEELGFGVRRFAARVVWTVQPGAPVPSLYRRQRLHRHRLSQRRRRDRDHVSHIKRTLAVEDRFARRDVRRQRAGQLRQGRTFASGR